MLEKLSIWCILVIFGAYLLYYCFHRYLCSTEVPGPICLPILGTKWLHLLRGRQLYNEQLHEMYKDLFNKYGQIVREEAFWNIPVISICSKTDIEKVLRHCSKYHIRPPTEVICFYRKSRPDRYVSSGLSNEQGEQWYRLRQKLAPLITSMETIKQFTKHLESIIDRFIQILNTVKNNQQNSNQVTNFEEILNTMCLESICSFILGRRIDFLAVFCENFESPKTDQTEVEIGTKLANSMKLYFCSLRDTFYGLPLWKHFATNTYNNFVKSEETIYDLVNELISATVTKKRHKGQTILLSILNETELDDREKNTAIIDFILGGLQTISNTLIFALYLLAKNPQVQDKLYAEVMNDSNCDKNNFYLKACIAESFRLYPTANCLARIIQSDLNLSGYQIKAGTVVLCHTGLACRDNDNFPNATEFRPERWLNECNGVYQRATNSTYLVTPFGFGSRMCPGKRFVEHELQIFLKKFIRQFHVEFSGELQLKFEFILAPKPPLTFVFKERTRS